MNAIFHHDLQYKIYATQNAHYQQSCSFHVTQPQMELRYGARRSWRPPSMGRLTVYRPAGVFPRCPWKNFLVLRPAKM